MNKARKRKVEEEHKKRRRKARIDFTKDLRNLKFSEVFSLSYYCTILLFINKIPSHPQPLPRLARQIRERTLPHGALWQGLQEQPPVLLGHHALVQDDHHAAVGLGAD